MHVATVIVNLTQPLELEMANSCDYPAAEIPLTVTWLHLTALHFLGQGLSRENAFPSKMLQPKEPDSTLENLSAETGQGPEVNLPEGLQTDSHSITNKAHGYYTSLWFVRLAVWSAVPTWWVHLVGHED